MTTTVHVAKLTALQAPDGTASVEVTAVAPGLTVTLVRPVADAGEYPIWSAWTLTLDRSDGKE